MGAKTPRTPLIALVLAATGLAATLCTPTLAAGAEACSNSAVRTGPSAALPDCRAYELVTPPSKNGTLVKEAQGNGEWVDPGGSSVIGASELAMSPSNTLGGGNLEAGSYYYLGRTAAGWRSTPISPPSSQYESFFSGNQPPLAGIGVDGGETLWVQRGLTLPSNELDVYVSPSPGAPLTDIGPITTPSTPLEDLQLAGEQNEPQVLSGSTDLSHVIFEVDEIGQAIKHGLYWPFDETFSGPSLYEYVGVGNGGETRLPTLVGVDNAGKVISQCGTGLGGPADARIGRSTVNPTGGSVNLSFSSGTHPVSSDGTVVFFTAINNEAEHCTGVQPLVDELYARVERAPHEYETVAISEPGPASCMCDVAPADRQAAYFVAASADGSKVFFTTGQPLLDGVGGLYEFDLAGAAGQKLRLVAPGGSPVQVSEDGSHVYFVAGGVLTGAANEFGHTARAGADNLYAFDTQTGTTAFVTAGPIGSSQATPDGRYLVFTSRADLTPDDTGTAQQVFEYDARSGELVRVSVGQGGYNDNGNLSNAQIAGEGLTMSDDGSYVVFTGGLLTPQAGGEENIYEYHSTGRIANGSVYALSDGVEKLRLLGTDHSGADVFFETINRLVAQDTDTQHDIYDARVGGGFPAPSAFAECAGEECEGQLSAAPVLLSAGSEFQAGGGNVQTQPVAPRAASPKGKTKRKTKTRKGNAKRKAKRTARRSRAASKGGRSMSRLVRKGK
jgi:Tol biopolymer transport system component